METLKKRAEFGEPKFAYIWPSTDFIGTLGNTISAAKMANKVKLLSPQLPFLVIVTYSSAAKRFSPWNPFGLMHPIRGTDASDSAQVA